MGVGGGVTFFDGPLRRKGLCWLPLWLFLVSVSKRGALFSQGTFSARGNGDGQFHSRPFTTAQGCPSITLLILSRFAPLHTEVAGHHECALSKMLQMTLLQMCTKVKLSQGKHPPATLCPTQHVHHFYKKRHPPLLSEVD